jgi:hypothetical protein
MPLDVQRTIFAAQQAEGARKQAYERGKQSQEAASLVRTQSQLDSVLKEQRQFFEKEFERLSEMAQMKGSQDAVRGVKSEIADPRYREYYNLGSDEMEVKGIQGRQAEAAAMAKREHEARMKGEEAKLTGLWDKQTAQADKYGMDAATSAAQLPWVGDLAQANVQKARFQGGDAPYDDDRFTQELLLRERGAAKTSVQQNQFPPGAVPQHMGEVRQMLGQLHSRRSELEGMIDPITGKLREYLDPSSLPAIRAELDELRQQEALLTKMWVGIGGGLGHTGKSGERHPALDQPYVDETQDQLKLDATQRALKRFQPKLVDE